MPMFTHKPTRVEAVQFKGGEKNAQEVMTWLADRNAKSKWYPPRSVEGLSGTIAMGEELHIRLGNSFAIASPGDWVVQDNKGKLHRFKHEEFEQDYVAS